MNINFLIFKSYQIIDQKNSKTTVSNFDLEYVPLTKWYTNLNI